MKSGGKTVEQNINHISRSIGVLAPVVILGYSMFIQMGYADKSHYGGLGLLLPLSALWIAYGLYQYLVPYATRSSVLLRLAMYHLFAATFILFIAGFSTELLFGWLIISLVSYLHFRWRGMILSLLVVVIIGLVDVYLRNYTSVQITELGLKIGGMIIIAAGVVAISGLRFDEQLELIKSQNREEIERERLLTIVNNLADSVFSTDKYGFIQVYNAAGLNLLDTNQGINDKHIDEVMKLHGTDGEAVELFKLIQNAKKVTSTEDMLLKIGDEDIRLALTYAPIRSSFSERNQDGSGEGYIVIARDITKLKSLEEERDEFISIVSHELRTPITVAEGTISNLQLMVERSIDDKQKLGDGLDVAHSQVMFLANMINDLSTLSRAERGIAGELEEIDVASLANDLHRQYSPEAEAQGLALNLELDPKLGYVNTSRLYLHELLQNLVTNAIKYTHDGSVTLAITKQQQNLEFAVTDTGIGIGKSEQKKIFAKFYRSEDYRTRETGGSGLGLYVSAKLATKLETSIDLKSRLNHGSTFSFKLPQAKVKANKA